MKTEDLKFQIGDDVFIEAFSTKGKVRALFIDNEGVQFQIRYFMNSAVQSTYFFAEELSKR